MEATGIRVPIIGRERGRELLFLLALDVLAVLFGLGGFIRSGFSGDALFQSLIPMGNIGGSLDNARYLNYLFGKTLYEHGFLVTEHYHVCAAFFLCSVVADLLLIQWAFLPVLAPGREDGASASGGRKRLWRLLVLWAATALVFVNVLFTEEFMFSEYHLNFGIAYFFGVLAFCLLARRRYLPGFALVVCACLFYQTAIIVTAVLITGYLVLEEDFRFSPGLVLREVLVDAGIMLVGFLDSRSAYWLVGLGILEPDEVGKELSPAWMDSLRDLAEQTAQLLKNSLGLLPSVWAPALVCLLSLGVLVASFIRGKAWDRLWVLALLLLAESLLVYSLPFASGSGSFYPRVVFTFYAVQGVLLLAAFREAPTARLGGAVAGAAVAYLVLQCFFMEQIVADRTLSNELDLLYGRAVLREIGKYEERTGERVTRVATARDADAPNHYEAVRFHRDQINERVLAVYPFCVLEYVNGTEGAVFEHVDMDPAVYAAHFAGRNWDNFDAEEQLVFVGDTLYWVVF